MAGFQVGDVVVVEHPNDSWRLARGLKLTVSDVRGKTGNLRFDELHEFDCDDGDPGNIYWAPYRFRLVSRPSEEWSNGDDVEWGTQPAKYVGPSPGNPGKHVIHIKGKYGDDYYTRTISQGDLRRPKPARTLEQLLERLGEGWELDEDGEAPLKFWFLQLLRKHDTGYLKTEIAFWEPTRQACIDAAWELLVKEDGDEAGDD